MEREILSSENKALKINLNSAIFGTIAEIGGGQEVAREFFRAGGASKTIAKSISAYDKNYSDAIYKSNLDRYVSESRLIKMLDVEYSELVELLNTPRGKVSTFFAFANTVETINYKKNNKGHGWLGMRFQLTPQSQSNDVIIHTILHENDTILQQRTLSILGINLIYAGFYLHNNIDEFLISLMDNLSGERLEINMLSVTGPDFANNDNRLLSVKLIKFGLTQVSVFDRNGEIQQPGDMVYNKNVMLLRGSFRPISFIELDMLDSGFKTFKNDVNFNDDSSLVLCEITLNNLMDDGEFNEKDFLDRVDLLNGMGQNVMISNFKEFYRLSAYVSQFNINQLRLIMGANILKRVINEKYYENLKGGILEAFGRLFGKHVKLYIYPYKQKINGPFITSKNIEIPSQLKYLFDYLLYNEKIIDIDAKKFDFEAYNNKKLSNMIKNNKKGWENMVPKYISENIIKKGLFEYKK